MPVTVRERVIMNDVVIQICTNYSLHAFKAILDYINHSVRLFKVIFANILVW